MRSIRRRLHIQPRGVLRRTADGRLLPATSEHDIGDIWAEQKRIQLHEAIEQDRRQAAKKASGTREFEIKIHMPKLHLGSFVNRARGLGPRRLTRGQKRWLLATLAFVVILVIVPFAYNRVAPGFRKQTATSHNKVASANTPIGGTKPDFPTLLPGKTIDKLGGWGRVSPPDKDPVFAYSDMLANVHIVVSEQRLPQSFESNLEGQLAQTAKQFGAATKLSTATTTTVYLGTASNGSQSVITSKKDLLILIRSSSKIADDQWASYLDSLQ